MPVRMTASIRGGLQRQKEKICIAMFSPNGMQRGFRMHRSMARWFTFDRTKKNRRQSCIRYPSEDHGLSKRSRVPWRYVGRVAHSFSIAEMESRWICFNQPSPARQGWATDQLRSERLSREHTCQKAGCGRGMPAINRLSRRFEPRKPHAAQPHGAFLVVFEAHAESAQGAQRAQIVVAVGKAA